MDESIMNKIEKEIEDERMKYGIMGTETATIIIKVTESEKEEFLNLELNEHWWYEIEDNELTVSYTEDI